ICHSKKMALFPRLASSVSSPVLQRHPVPNRGSVVITWARFAAQRGQVLWGVQASDAQWVRREKGCEPWSEGPSGACKRQPSVAGVDVGACCCCPVCSAVLAQQPV
ncbi:hypothetical protein KUCAC02_012240, partial [Chaenocephalus aceratus]